MEIFNQLYQSDHSKIPCNVSLYKAGRYYLCPIYYDRDRVLYAKMSSYFAKLKIRDKTSIDKLLIKDIQTYGHTIYYNKLGALCLENCKTAKGVWIR